MPKALPVLHSGSLQAALQAVIGALSCSSPQGCCQPEKVVRPRPRRAPRVRALLQKAPAEWEAGSGASGARWEGLFLEALPQAK